MLKSTHLVEFLLCVHNTMKIIFNHKWYMSSTLRFWCRVTNGVLHQNKETPCFCQVPEKHPGLACSGGFGADRGMGRYELPSKGLSLSPNPADLLIWLSEDVCASLVSAGFAHPHIWLQLLERSCSTASSLHCSIHPIPYFISVLSWSLSPWLFSWLAYPSPSNLMALFSLGPSRCLWRNSPSYLQQTLLLSHT